jgi:ketosteroid isomerase-like protein
MAESPAKGRTFVERAALRWPKMVPRAVRSVLRLPPESRARRAILRQAAEAAFEAWNRGDFALVPHIDDPQVETHFTQGAGTKMDMAPVYYGAEGHCQGMETWNEAWGTWEAEIEEIIEEGRDRIVVVSRVHAEGAASGAKLDEWGAVRYTFREGRIVRVDAALASDRAHVLEALRAGLSARA